MIMKSESSPLPGIRSARNSKKGTFIQLAYPNFFMRYSPHASRFRFRSLKGYLQSLFVSFLFLRNKSLLLLSPPPFPTPRYRIIWGGMGAFFFFSIRGTNIRLKAPSFLNHDLFFPLTYHLLLITRYSSPLTCRILDPISRRYPCKPSHQKPSDYLLPASPA